MQNTAQFSKSKIPCLLRHRGGKYYASAKVGGKIIRRSLDTEDYNVAKNRLTGILEEMRGARNATAANALIDALHAEAMRNDPTIKDSTQGYYQAIAKSLTRCSSALADDPMMKPISKVTLQDLRALMDTFATKVKATSYNGALALLRRTYDRAVEAGHVANNIPRSLKRLSPLKKKHDLPTAEVFAMIVKSILDQKLRHSKAAAMSVEVLAYTGLRISEAQSLRWRDIKEETLVVRTAKNDDIRQVPLIPAMKELITRVKAAEIPTAADDPVLLIKSPRIALAGACSRLGIDHMRVHDLRHIFATRCIEAGVDLPTLASWLGHKDGGVLCAQVYGHLCKKHSTAMAGRVRA